MINDRGEPVVMDFGLARKVSKPDTQLTQVGVIMGTPAYMSPEQVSGRAEDQGPGCDIYSLGVILYQSLTKQMPFDADDLLALLTQIATATPNPPSSLRDDVDPRLDAICLKAMARQQEDRYQSAREFGQALLDYMTEKGIESEADMSIFKLSDDPSTGKAADETIRGDFKTFRQPSATAKAKRRRNNSTITMIAVASLLVCVALIGLMIYGAWNDNSPPVANPDPTVETPEEPSNPTNPIAPIAPKQQRLKIFILAGQSNMGGVGMITDLVTAMQDPKTGAELKHLDNIRGKIGQRDDVWIKTLDTHTGQRKSGVLHAGYGEQGSISPALGFGHIVGEYYDEPILLIKVHYGPGALYDGFRPPSSGGETGKGYSDLVNEVKTITQRLLDILIYEGKGFDIEGLVWFQGWNDVLNAQGVSEYESNLANLYRDLKNDLKAPKCGSSSENWECTALQFKITAIQRGKTLLKFAEHNLRYAARPNLMTPRSL